MSSPGLHAGAGLDERKEPGIAVERSRRSQYGAALLFLAIRLPLALDLASKLVRIRELDFPNEVVLRLAASHDETRQLIDEWLGSGN